MKMRRKLTIIRWMDLAVMVMEERIEEVIENRIYVGGGNEFEYLSNEYLMKDL